MHFVKQILIPHKNNSYRPHLIRRHGLAFALLAILASQVLSGLQIEAESRVLGYASNVSVSGLLSSTNAERSANGKSSLDISTKLNTAAQAKANHMIANNYWSHTSPDGVTPWYWFDYVGYDYLSAGENLAYGFDTSSGVVAGWMGSPSHRDNMLNGTFEQVGFGIANGSNYQGGQNTVVVAMYGDPAVLAETAPPPAPAPAAAPAPAPAPAPEPVAAKPEAEEAKAIPAEPPVADSEETAPAPMETEFAAEQPRRISNLEALMRGQAGWALYLTAAVALAIGFVYLYRHVLFIHNAIVKGENYLVSHPMLEASIIYALIWLLLSGSFGSIL